jgi:hypothetical protein
MRADPLDRRFRPAKTLCQSPLTVLTEFGCGTLEGQKSRSEIRGQFRWQKGRFAHKNRQKTAKIDEDFAVDLLIPKELSGKRVF